MSDAYAAFLAAVRTAAAEHDKTLGHVDGPDAWALADAKFYAAVVGALTKLHATEPQP